MHRFVLSFALIACGTSTPSGERRAPEPDTQESPTPQRRGNSEDGTLDQLVASYATYQGDTLKSCDDYSLRGIDIGSARLGQAATHFSKFLAQVYEAGADGAPDEEKVVKLSGPCRSELSDDVPPTSCECPGLEGGFYPLRGYGDSNVTYPHEAKLTAIMGSEAEKLFAEIVASGGSVHESHIRWKYGESAGPSTAAWAACKSPCSYKVTAYRE